MILSLLGTIIGFLGSMVGPIISLYKSKMDNAHELEMFRANVEMSKIQHEAKMAELSATADIEETKVLHQSAMPIGVKWVDALNALVRPLFSYAFFGIYIAVKCYHYMEASKLGPSAFMANLDNLWTEVDMSIFCSIVAFWFGNRTFGKMLGYEGKIATNKTIESAFRLPPKK